MNLNDLKKQLPYKWRVQSASEYSAVCVAYIDSRDVQDLLDEVVGAENWQSDYKEVKGNIYSGLAIKTGDEWVWKWDCGVESKTEAEKGEASDAFKRAAVKWGIGRFLYALEIKRLKSIKYKDKYYALNEATGKAFFDGEELTNYINNLSKKPENKNGANLHNRTKIGTNEKPLISNVQFKQLMERVRNGETMAGLKAIATFSFEEKQLSTLNDALKQLA